MERPRRTQEEVEQDLKEFELVERRVNLLRQLVLLVISVAFAVVAIICALRGYHWPSLATGGSSGLTAAVGALGHRRGG